MRLVGILEDVDRGSRRESLEAQVASFPGAPGVYLFKDGKGRVLYVGKADVLRDRVRAYFGPTLDVRHVRMVERAERLEYVLTGSISEAFLLEANLIKQHRPRYNIRLKDDKSYPYVKVTLGEDFPRILRTRTLGDRAARYFGPFANAKAVDESLDLLQKLFPYRTCKLTIVAGDDGRGRTVPPSALPGGRPCLLFHLRRCTAPCVGNTTKDDYRTTIDKSVLFLEGRYEFKGDDFDVLAAAVSEGDAVVQVFRVRDGTIVSRDHFALEGSEGAAPADVLGSFLRQHYATAAAVPPEIVVPTPVADAGGFVVFASERRAGPVRLLVPQRGKKRHLAELAARNAEDALEQERVRWLADRGKTDTALRELAEALGLDGPPKRIECYDVSHVQGTSVVSSMVVFEDGRAAKHAYRRFRAKVGDRNDDFANMRDTLRRRFQRSVNDGDGWPIPDLVILDGGKGQLSAGQAALSDAGLLRVPIAALAKEREELFVPARPDPILLPRTSQGLYLVQRIRDEAHRFAVTYHQNVRAKRAVRSVLDDVDGVGPARKRALLRRFGSVRGIREASLDELAKVAGVGPALAGRIKQAVES